MLDVTGLESRYGRIPVLHGIDLAVRAGELVAWWAQRRRQDDAAAGPFRRSTRLGKSCFRGQDISCFRRTRVALGIVQCPEGRQVFGPLSVEDNLRLGAYRRGGAQARDAGRVYALFPPSPSAAGRGTLSGGSSRCSPSAGR